MRKIGAIPKQQEDAFSGYLHKASIEHQIDEDGLVWILADHELKKAKQLLEEFQQKPEEFASFAQLKPKPPKPVKDKKPLIQHASPFFVTNTMIFICVALFLLQLADKDGVLRLLLHFSNDHMGNFYGVKSFVEIRNGELWRLVSPIFLHSGMLHIFFNMYWLYLLGGQIEANETRRHYLQLFLLAAIIPNVGFYLIAGPAFEGMSGVIYGLMGYMWVRTELGRGSYMMHEGTYQFFAVWYVICFILPLVGMRIANSIHGIGAVTGMLYAYGQTCGFRELNLNTILRLKGESRGKFLILTAMLFGGIIVDRIFY